LKNEILVVSAANFLVIGANYLIRAIMAKSMSVAEYGLFFAFMSFFSILAVFTDGGFMKALISRVPKLESEEERRDAFSFIFWIRFLLGTFILILCYVFSGVLSKYVFHTTQTTLFLQFSIMIIITHIFYDYVNNSFRALNDMKSFSLLQIFRYGGILALFIILFTFEPSLRMAVLAYFVGPIIFIIFYSRKIPKLKSFSKNLFAENKGLLFLGLGIFLTVIGATLLTYTDTIMVSFFLGPESVGLYQVAVPLAKLLLLLSFPISVVMLPKISKMVKDKEFNRIKDYLGKAYILSMVVFGALGYFIYYFHEHLIKLLFSADYLGAAEALPFLLMAMFASIILTINIQYFYAIEKTKRLNIYLLVGVIINIILNIWLIPQAGIQGAAIATLAAYLVIAFLTFTYIRGGQGLKSAS